MIVRSCFFVINLFWLITLLGFTIAKDLKNKFMHKFAPNG